MIYYSGEQTVCLKGVFLEYDKGYYSFELENGDIIDFEEINKNILLEYDLKSTVFKNKKFNITYKEIFDDLDDVDFVIFKLDKIELM